MILLEPSGQETQATGFLGGFHGVYAGQNVSDLVGSLLNVAVSW